ncbi:MAG: hypothetical protein HQ485_08565 [Acidobacteria bacterium]|nr:hypothetical protein [Acidobacteriota bacterium]
MITDLTGLTDLIVYAAVGLTAAFVIAWAIRPDLREWIERPKFHFLESVRRYDRERTKK